MSHDAIIPKSPMRNFSLREWFVDYALSNSDITGELRSQKAIEIATICASDMILGTQIIEHIAPRIEIATIYASDMIKALKSPRLPTKIESPTEKQMEQWVQVINNMGAETNAPMKRRHFNKK